MKPTTNDNKRIIAKDIFEVLDVLFKTGKISRIQCIHQKGLLQMGFGVLHDIKQLYKVDHKMQQYIILV